MIRSLHKEDLCTYDIVLDLVGTLHNQVLELGPIDPPRCGGSRRGKRPNIARGRVEGHERLMKDYFVENPVYDARMFHQRFRMSKRLFLRIVKKCLKLRLIFCAKIRCHWPIGVEWVAKIYISFANFSLWHRI